MKKNLSNTSFYNALLKSFGFPPTGDQTTAMQLLATYITNTNELEIFILTGYAGTGKTTLIAALINTLSEYEIRTVNIAPTGRAAKVLANYSKQQTATIHRKIYFSDQSIENGSGYTLGKNLHRNTIFIVDEASMIASSTANGFNSRDLLFDLVEYVYSGHNCKLIFVGDVGQLPPVGSADSPALNKKTLKDLFSFDILDAHLREILRQDELSGILALATQLRNFTDEIPLLYNDNTEVILTDGTELEDALETAIGKYGQDEVIVITRSNKRANLFNQQIRHRILWQEDDLNAGDILMITKNNYFWIDQKSEAGFLANGELIEVLKVIRREEIFGFEFADIEARLIDYPYMTPQEFKININSIRSEGPALTRDEMSGLFYRIASEEYPLERNKKIRNRLVMQHPFFQALQVKFGYAITGHKSQGGQWDCVFVDLGYFVEDMWDESMMRWLYTVVTRAKQKLYLINFPKPFTGQED